MLILFGTMFAGSLGITVLGALPFVTEGGASVARN